MVKHQFSSGKIPSYICMEILLRTNVECTRNFSHGIIPTFFWILIGFRSELFAYRVIYFICLCSLVLKKHIVFFYSKITFNCVNYHSQPSKLLALQLWFKHFIKMLTLYEKYKPNISGFSIQKIPKITNAIQNFRSTMFNPQKWKLIETWFKLVIKLINLLILCC
jgi:hypothetical protein